MIASAPPNRKHDILDAAARVIARSGVARLRVSDVAREAGVSTALVHYYWHSRARLIEEAFARVDALADAAATAGFGGVASGRERLELLLASWAGEDTVIQANWAVWSELWSQALRDEWARRQVASSHGRWLEQLETLLEEARADGSLPAALDGAAAARRLAACANEWGREMLLSMRSSREFRRDLLLAVEHEAAAARGVAA